MNFPDKTELPLVSVIIPCYNEEKLIGGCLDSLIDNTYPQQKIEVLVYDGGSTDNTCAIVKNYENKYSFIKLKNNPNQFQAYGVNQGIKESNGEIIVRCDAHAEYSSNYIINLVGWLKKDKMIGNAGGILINKPANSSYKACGIADALSHQFCVGPNSFRTGVKCPTFVDTVPFGCWRKEIFGEVGAIDETFLRAQDLEFNMRLKKAGYKILLDPEIKIYYYTRENFKKLYSMMFQYGYWKVVLNKKLEIISSWRQFAPPFFVLYLFALAVLFPLIPLVLVPLGIYMVLCLIFGLKVSLKEKNINILPFCCLTFIVTHIGYGLGYLKGIIDVFILKKKKPVGKYSEVTR